MNLELRMDVLEKSLQLENSLSTILALLFRINKGGSKTLGHKTSALSFKTKADLLKDLDQISNEEYQDLVTFMEIRNQLIHNLEIDTLTKAIR